MSTWYKAGAVNVTETSTTVVGVGTLFTLYANAGDIFTVDGGRIYEIASVDSNTTLTLSSPYAESTAAGVDYGIITRPGDPLESDVLTDIQTLVTLWTQRETDFTNWLTGVGTINLTTIGGSTVPVSTPTQLNADLAATAKTAAGAMVTGNTETGITVTYQAGDQTLDFELQYAGTGVASTVARSDHTHSAYAATGHTHAAFTASTAGFVPAPVSATGRFLKDDGTWATVSFSGMTLNDLSSVAVSGPISGNLFYYNGTNWVNGSAATIGLAAASHAHAASDVTSGTFAIARIPMGTSGSTAAYGNHVHNLDALTDVAIAAAASGHVLYHNGTQWVNGTTSAAGVAATSHSHDASAITTGSIAIGRLPTGTSASTVALGNHTHTAAIITDLTEAVQDIAGGMVSGNTEQGMVVSYDDLTGTLNFTLSYAGSGGAFGVATTPARSDHTHTFTASAVSDMTEAVQDVMGASLASGNGGLAVSYNDTTGITSYTLQYGGSGSTFGSAVTVARSDHTHAIDTEAVQDAVGSAITAGTKTGMTVTYDDANNRINYSVSFGGTGAATTVARSDHTHTTYAGLDLANTFTQNQTISSTLPMFVLSETDVATTYTLRSHTGLLQIYKNANTGTKMEFDGSTFSAVTVTQTSDLRYKQNIEPLTDALDTICDIDGVRFDWKHSGKPDIGVIAQDLRDVLPEVVHTDSDGYLSVNYAALVPVLIEAIKELTDRVYALENP